MSGSTVTRWVISDDGSHLIRREEVEAAFPKGMDSQLGVKEDNFNRPVTNVSASPSLSTNTRQAVPALLPVSYPCAYCDICFTASHYLEKHVKRSHRKQYLEMLRSRNITFSKTPASTSATSIKTITSPAATFSKAPASILATVIKPPTNTAVAFSKAVSSSPATFTETPTTPPVTFSKPSSSSLGHSGPPLSQAAPLASPKSICSPSKVESAPSSQSDEPQASKCSAGSTVICVTPLTPDRTSDPPPLTPAPNTTKHFASVQSSGQIGVKPILKDVTMQDLAQPLRLPSEAEEVKNRGSEYLSSSCTHCRGSRDGQDQGEGEKECCCEEGTLFLCNECGQSFPSFPSLSFHQDQAHWGKGQGQVEEGETLYLCTECGLSFPHLELLGHHQSLHDSSGAKDREEGTEEEEKDEDTDSLSFASQVHSCPNCQKSFKTARYLKTHMKIHSGQVPYHCDQCDKPFTQLGDLKTHRRTHTGERPYQCSQCGKCFGRSGTLKKHWRTHTGETPYVCAVCGKQFNQLGALKTHERIHTGQRPYFCSRCSQHFTYSYQLKRHRCVHSDKSRGASE